MIRVGLPYVGRQGVYEQGEANILFVLGQLKKLQPNADYGHGPPDTCGTFEWRRHFNVLRQTSSRTGIEGYHAR
jgi:hypothetical protein